MLHNGNVPGRQSGKKAATQTEDGTSQEMYPEALFSSASDITKNR
jgi:hypothetical protein